MGLEQEGWVNVGLASELSKKPLQSVRVQRTLVALSYQDGEFRAISGTCNHAGGPLGEGRLEGDYVVCPWHSWKFHRATGEGEPGYEEDRVPRYDVRVENGQVWIQRKASSRRNKLAHPPHPLETIVRRGEPGGPPLNAPWRIVGISATNMDEANPRFSTSEHLLKLGLEHAQTTLGADTRLIRLSSLRFRACEGYYSKAARACTWPCSITQMDPSDEMEQVYEAVVQWADIIVIASPIRWGVASSLYFRMQERMNCIQNQETIADRILMRNKVAAFIITGGQDNVQGVVGQMMTFFGELGCQFPQFPFIAHSRGWSAEDMENNVKMVEASTALAEGSRELMERCVETAEALMGHMIGRAMPTRGGRKAHALVEPTSTDELDV